MIAFLSRQRSGDYMLTSKKPVQHPVDGRDSYEDLYVSKGDSLGLRYLCPWGVRAIFGVELRPFQTIEVELVGGTREPVVVAAIAGSTSIPVFGATTVEDGVDLRDHSENDE